MTDIIEKVKDLREATERLKVHFADFERAEINEKAEKYLKKAKALGYIHSYRGDKDFEQE